jgi:hypothetical protein
MTTFIYHKQNIKPNGVQDESSIVLWDIKTCKDMQFDNSNNTKPTKTNKKNGSELRCSACVALRVTPVIRDSIRCSDTSEIVVPIMISYIKGCC